MSADLFGGKCAQALGGKLGLERLLKCELEAKKIS